jgi:hypothetical protein
MTAFTHGSADRPSGRRDSPRYCGVCAWPTKRLNRDRYREFLDQPVSGRRGQGEALMIRGVGMRRQDQGGACEIGPGYTDEAEYGEMVMTKVSVMS